MKANARRSIPEIERVIDKDILPKWGKTALEDITETKIKKWIIKLIESPKKTRGGKHFPLDDSPEGLRKRRATAQRKWNIFRAVLNSVSPKWVDSREWAGIKNLKDLDPPETEFPTTAECKRLINRTEKEFRPIVEATFLTGTAYSEITSLKVQDYYPSTGHVRVFNSKRRSRHIPLSDEGTALFDEHTASKSAEAFIFTRNDGEPWKKGDQHR